MIDAETFAEEWSVLEDRFGEEYSDAVQRRYFEYLTERMETEEFVEASRELFATRRFFPSPADFTEVAGPSEEARAYEQWRKVLREVESRDRTDLEEAAREAIRVLGGMRAIRNAVRSEIPFLRKEFLEVYRAYQKRVRGGPSRVESSKPQLMIEEGDGAA